METESLPDSPQVNQNDAQRPFSIRRASSADAEDVTRLWVSMQRDNAALEPRLRISPSAEERFKEHFVSLSSSPVAACFVGHCEAEIAGFVLGQIHERPTLALGDCGYVSDLYVESKHRLQGLGTALYTELRDWFHSREITTIELQIVRANSASQAFWRRMGFTDFLRTLRNDRIGP